MIYLYYIYIFMFVYLICWDYLISFDSFCGLHVQVFDLYVIYMYIYIYVDSNPRSSSHTVREDRCQFGPPKLTPPFREGMTGWFLEDYIITPYYWGYNSMFPCFSGHLQGL